MKNDKYVITTDYKSGGLFSAVFSFECDKKSFDSMDKTDLLHSYLVSQIILSFDEENYESDFSQPYFLSDTIETVKNVVNSVKKQAGGNRFNDKLQKTIDAIEAQFPVETEQIKKIVKDDTKLVCTSFFVPQILNSLIQEYELNNCKNCKYLIAINLTEFVSISASKNQAVIIDFINAWKKSQGEKTTPKFLKRSEDLKKMIKQTLHLNMISSGDFAQFIERKNKKDSTLNDTETQEGETP